MNRCSLAVVLLLMACSKEPTAPRADSTSTIEHFDVERASFGSTVVDCHNGDIALIDSAWAAIRGGLQKESNPTIGEATVMPATFRDAKGTVVRITYTIEPGDPDEVNQEEDTLLVSDTCQTILM